MTDNASAALLTGQARSLLEYVLRQANFPGSQELRNQISSVRVLGGPVTMLDLGTSNQCAASAFRRGPIPLSVGVADATGNPIGELLIWVDHGYLRCLEYAWYTDDPPVHLPAVENLRVTLV